MAVTKFVLNETSYFGEGAEVFLLMRLKIEDLRRF